MIIIFQRLITRRHHDVVMLTVIKVQNYRRFKSCARSLYFHDKFIILTQNLRVKLKSVYNIIADIS